MAEHTAIKLLNEWLTDNSGYDESTWPELKERLARELMPTADDRTAALQEHLRREAEMRDAARYRWLRENYFEKSTMIADGTPVWKSRRRHLDELLCGPTFDAAVDAAMLGETTC